MRTYLYHCQVIPNAARDGCLCYPVWDGKSSAGRALPSDIRISHFGFSEKEYIPFFAFFLGRENTMYHGEKATCSKKVVMGEPLVGTLFGVCGDFWEDSGRLRERCGGSRGIRGW